MNSPDRGRKAMNNNSPGVTLDVPADSLMASYLRTAEYPQFGWRISHDGGALVFENKDFLFGSRRDCEIAIRSFAKSGITTPGQLAIMDDAEISRIACSELLW